MALLWPNEYGTLYFHESWFSEQGLFLWAIVFRKQWLMSGTFPRTWLLAHPTITGAIWVIWNDRVALRWCTYTPDLFTAVLSLFFCGVHEKCPHTFLDVERLCFFFFFLMSNSLVVKDDWLSGLKEHTGKEACHSFYTAWRQQVRLRGYWHGAARGDDGFPQQHPGPSRRLTRLKRRRFRETTDSSRGWSEGAAVNLV